MPLPTGCRHHLNVSFNLLGMVSLTVKWDSHFFPTQLKELVRPKGDENQPCNLQMAAQAMALPLRGSSPGSHKKCAASRALPPTSSVSCSRLT